MQKTNCTASGFLRRDLLIELRSTVLAIASRGADPREGGSSAARLDEVACSLATELATSGGIPEIVGALIDVYSTSRSMDGDLWAARALDDVICDICVFCRVRSRVKVKNADKVEHARKLDCIIVRLLCRLTLLVCRAADMRAGRNPVRTAHVFEVDRMLPTDLAIDEVTGRIKLDACDAEVEKTRSRSATPLELRAAVVASMRHHVAVEKNGSNARALVHLLVSRCGRTLRDYNAMHTELMDRINAGESGDCKSGDCKSGDCKSGDGESGDGESGDGESGDCKSGDCESGDGESGDCESGDCESGDCEFDSAFLPLTFEGTSDVYRSARANAMQPDVLEYSVVQSNVCRKSDVVWAIWRALRDVSEADSAASEFVTRMASLYSFRWAPTRRDERLNIILYASVVALRGCVRCEEPDEDFIELIDIAEARAENAFNDIVEFARNRECE